MFQNTLDAFKVQAHEKPNHRNPYAVRIDSVFQLLRRKRVA